MTRATRDIPRFNCIVVLKATSAFALFCRLRRLCSHLITGRRLVVVVRRLVVVVMLAVLVLIPLVLSFVVLAVFLSPFSAVFVCRL